MTSLSNTEDGKCIVEPLVGPGFQSEQASERSVVLGAAGLIKRCIEQKNPSEGGLVKGIGT